MRTWQVSLPTSFSVRVVVSAMADSIWRSKINEERKIKNEPPQSAGFPHIHRPHQQHSLCGEPSRRSREGRGGRVRLQRQVTNTPIGSMSILIRLIVKDQYTHVVAAWKVHRAIVLVNGERPREKWSLLDQRRLLLLIQWASLVSEKRMTPSSVPSEKKHFLAYVNALDFE